MVGLEIMTDSVRFNFGGRNLRMDQPHNTGLTLRSLTDEVEMLGVGSSNLQIPRPGPLLPGDLAVLARNSLAKRAINEGRGYLAHLDIKPDESQMIQTATLDRAITLLNDSKFTVANADLEELTKIAHPILDRLANLETSLGDDGVSRVVTHLLRVINPQHVMLDEMIQLLRERNVTCTVKNPADLEGRTIDQILINGNDTPADDLIKASGGQEEVMSLIEQFVAPELAKPEEAYLLIKKHALVMVALLDQICDVNSPHFSPVELGCLLKRLNDVFPAV
jgi:hypothetical protein